MTFVKRKQNSRATRQPEMKFRKTFFTTGARNLGVPNLSLHSPMKLDSVTHFHTFNHVMAEVKHLRSKMSSWKSYLKRHDRIRSAKGDDHVALFTLNAVWVRQCCVWLSTNDYFEEPPDISRHWPCSSWIEYVWSEYWSRYYCQSYICFGWACWVTNWYWSSAHTGCTVVWWVVL